MASLLLAFICTFLILLSNAQNCPTTPCAADEFCSTFDNQCYAAFNKTDFSGTFDNDRKLVDNDVSTFVTLPGGNIPTTLSFSFPSSYWVHGVQLIVSKELTAQQISIDGVTQSIDSPVEVSGREVYNVATTNFPLSATSFTVLVFLTQQDLNVYSFNVFGTYDTPMPSQSPTIEPTADTNAPSSSPTASPSFSPSQAPTGFPTPDICEDYTVRQSCCGAYDYQIEDDKVNLRDPDSTQCKRSIIQPCCGNYGNGIDIRLNVNNTIESYRCTPDSSVPFDGGVNADSVLCNPLFLNTSMNATDDIVGTILNGTNIFLNNTEGVFDVNNVLNWCQCEFIAYECEGDDMAICGSQEKYDDLFDDACWGNDTVWTKDDDFENETCYKNIVAGDKTFEHLIWEPCSEESFQGSVTDVTYIPDETILNGDCSCSYNIRDCHVLEDRTKQCSPSDCENGGQCSIETANPCCSSEIDYNYEKYKQGQGVVPDNMADPQSWTCAANASIPLCPDIFGGTRKYTVESRVDWWYDADANKINSRCGCLYTSDECNLPTMNPTVNPTSQPSKAPVVVVIETTAIDESEAMRLLVSYSTLFIMIHSVFCA